MAKQRRYREKTAGLVDKLERLVFQNRDLRPAIDHECGKNDHGEWGHSHVQFCAPAGKDGMNVASSKKVPCHSETI